ncbi:MAG: aryl-sulfate sulfotransferase [Rhodospirillaceae bacterium]|jgi:predicted DNA-binding ribbon-helix-helix protein|nr:aryl-sulfate sulfotransferase [Rhodospirillaceae bacterium]|tara:strand:- start:93 stop:353 length:261 start_codon:yes stop_codon:yes gene_type:complete
MSAPSAAEFRIRKRSVVIQGHATSVSLEEAFWRALKAIAGAQGLSVNALIADIDRRRTEDFSGGASGNLSSAIRVFVLQNTAGGGD